jgi:rare lipoprotein A
MPTRSSPHRSIAAATLASLLFAACAPQPAPPTERGRISHYGHEFAGRKTASGVAFDPDALTMAHRTLPFGTRVRVTNLANQKTVDVVVNDRGPAVQGRIADLSLGAARRIDMVQEGVVEGMLEVLPKER